MEKTLVLVISMACIVILNGQPTQYEDEADDTLSDSSSDYYFIKARLTYTQANAACKKRGMRLVTVMNSAQNSFIQRGMKKRGMKYAWVGLNDRAKEGKMVWSYGCPSYKNFNRGEPNGKRDENCVHMFSKHGRWNDLKCTRKISAVCHTPTVFDKCGAPSGYGFIKTKMTYAQADATCKKNGMRLVTISNSGQNKLVQREMKKRGMKYAWVGLNDRAKEGKMVWSYGCPSYKNFNRGEPNGKRDENCVHMFSKHGRWNDLKCTRKIPAVCHTPTVFDKCGAPSGYGFIKTKMTYAQADATCKKNGMRLVTISNSGQNKLVQREMKKRGMKYAWVGLNDRAKEGKMVWSYGCPSYKNFNRGEPNGKRDENCVHMFSKHGRWNDLKCTRKISAVCHTATIVVDECGAPSGYGFIKTSMTYAQADATCKKNGMRLVTISNSDQNKLVQREIKKRGMKYAWVGLNDRAKEGNMVWAYGCPSYKNFNHGEPNGKRDENCVHMFSKHGRWNDLKCKRKIPAVCHTATAGNCQAHHVGHEYHKVVYEKVYYKIPADEKKADATGAKADAATSNADATKA